MDVYLYDEGTSRSLNAGGLVNQLAGVAGLAVEVRAEFVTHWIDRGRADASSLGDTGSRLVKDHPNSLAEALVRARVVDPMARLQPDREPMPVELSAERRTLSTPGRTSRGILYDGAQIQAVLAELIVRQEVEACHIVLTGRLVGSYMPEDGRWHAHTGMYGEPSLISMSGLVQAPARPREYYQAQSLAATGMAPREVVEARLQQEMAERMLLPDDPRLNEVVVGHVLQAVHFHCTGEAFCKIPACRLFNARRQEDLLRAQCGSEASLCPKHRAFFEALEADHG